MFYAVVTDPKDVDATASTVEKAAGRYGSEINYRHGRGEFIGNSSDAGSDREQRDAARSIYEENIRQSIRCPSPSPYFAARGLAVAMPYLTAAAWLLIPSPIAAHR
jgi:hypothetical protein